MSKPGIIVCLSPFQIGHFSTEGKTVVLIDIFRATSTIVTALHHGVKEVIPVGELEQCLAMKSEQNLCAGERNGHKAKGFDLGNSPQSYLNNEHKGKSLILTTTNGTSALAKCIKPGDIYAGAFLNITATINALKEAGKDLFILCAGWKGRVNVEDTLYAGAIIEALQDDFWLENDGALMSLALWQQNKHDNMPVIEKSQYYQRLGDHEAGKDIEFCMQMDVYSEVVVLKEKGFKIRN